VHVRELAIVPSVRKKALAVRATVSGAPPASAALVLDNEVLLSGRVVLRLPTRQVTARGARDRRVAVTAPWADPVLWGPPPWGQPVLYTLKTTLRGEQGQVLDELRTRFGFREFWTEGPRFVLNGKPFFIKGDLVFFHTMYTETRDFITQFLQAERAANINFIRLHCAQGFLDEAWLEVGDELGMIIEPQQYLRSPIQAAEKNRVSLAGPEAAPYLKRFRLLQDEWRAFIADNRNRPCVVMYSIDNEAVPQADWGQPDVGQTVPPATRDLDRIHRLVRDLDPTRLIEEQGDVRLATAFARGEYGELQVFNAHPYGDPLGKALQGLEQAYHCPPDIPVHVGEMYLFCQDPFNWWTRPASWLRRPGTMYRQFRRWGEYMSRSILSVREAGAAGASLCSGVGAFYFGPQSPSECQLGAWDVRMMDADFSDPEAGYGRGKTVNVPVAELRYSSLSGPGVKPRWLVQAAPQGYGLELNWCDPTRPAYVTTVAHEMVRQAFHDVDGADVGPLRAWRAPEVVVATPAERTAGQYVFLDDQGALVAPDGTARFVVSEPGRHLVTCPALGARASVEVAAPKLAPKAGYGHVQWVELGGVSAADLRRSLAQPLPLQLADPVARPVNRAGEDAEQEAAVTQGAPYAIRWGDGRLFEFDAFSGVAPDYIRGAGVQGGSQDHTRLSYVIPESAPEYTGHVRFWVDRKLTRGNLRLEIEAQDTGFLYAQLRGDLWEPVCNNLTEGNLLAGTGRRVVKTLEITLDKYPAATTIVLARYQGRVEVYRTTVTPLWQARAGN
jgi:hypothetical protein